MTDSSINATIDTPLVIHVLRNDSDPDGDRLSVVSATQPKQGVISVNSDGTIRYEPAPGFVGDDMFRYTISDGRGGLDSADVKIKVAVVNRLPIALPDMANTTRNKEVKIRVLLNDVDPDGGPLKVIAVSQGENGRVTISDSKEVKYKPAPYFFGCDKFTYTIIDREGGAASAQVTVNVIGRRGAPTAVPDEATTTRNTPVNIPVLANDTDPEGDRLIVVNVTQGTHGSVSINPDGTVRYEPFPDFAGIDSFTYAISDGFDGAFACTVTVTVATGNRAPIAVPDAVVTLENAAVDIPVLLNDADVEGDSLTVVSVTAAAHGRAEVLEGRIVRYAPEAHFFGMDVFQYTISDGRGGFATTFITAIVNPVNDAPVANPDAVTVLENTRSFLPGAALLANDTDVDQDPLSVTSVSPVSARGGSLEMLGDLVMYIPPAFFTGADSFTYIVNDRRGGTATSTVALQVMPPTMQVLSQLRFNPQTSLFEQLVRVTNPLQAPVGGTMSGARVLVNNLPPGARVHNASGTTNGLFYVQYDQALAPGESVDFMIEFYLLDWVHLPTPGYLAQCVRTAASLPPSGSYLSIDRVMSTAGRFLIEFTATPGQSYAVQYSDDMFNWRTALPFIQAPANRVQWFDDGPPKTETKPAEAGIRLYRVVALPTP
jgi:hypothetical protein